MPHKRGGADVKAEVLKTLNWVKEKLENSTGLSAYPVGSIYMSVNATSPSDLFGGTWEALEQGRVLIGQGSSYPAGSTGGEATHTLSLNEMPSHNHGGTFSGSGTTSSAGSHSHTVEVWYPDGTSYQYGENNNGGWRGSVNTSSSGSHTHTFSVSGNINTNGGDTAFNLMQPYIACYMWRRIA